MALDQATVDLTTMLADLSSAVSFPVVQAEQYPVPGDLKEYFMYNGDYSRASAFIGAIVSSQVVFLLFWGGYQSLKNWFSVGNL